MFVAMPSRKPLSPLGQYIEKQLRLRQTDEGKPWSIRELARRSKLSNSGLSVIMRGGSVPDTTTLEKIATALEVPVQELLVAAGLEVPPEPKIDRSAAYIARRLSELPGWLQEQAIDATAKLVDAYSGIAQNGHVEVADDEQKESDQPEEPIADEPILFSQEEKAVLREALELYIQRRQEEKVGDKHDTAGQRLTELLSKVADKSIKIVEDAAKAVAQTHKAVTVDTE
jgi:transcriptional regulator with XRE-family HTH domain